VVGKGFFGKEPQLILDELISSDPETALLLFKQLGTMADTRKRFLSYFSVESILSIIKLFKSAEEAVSVFYTSSAIIALQFAGTDFQGKAVDKHILGLIWETMIVHHYQYFNIFAYYANLCSEFEIDLPSDEVGWLKIFQNKDHFVFDGQQFKLLEEVQSIINKKMKYLVLMMKTKKNR